MPDYVLPLESICLGDDNQVVERCQQLSYIILPHAEDGQYHYALLSFHVFTYLLYRHHTTEPVAAI
jgi:hypothetical protein